MSDCKWSRHRAGSPWHRARWAIELDLLFTSIVPHIPGLIPIYLDWSKTWKIENNSNERSCNILQNLILQFVFYFTGSTSKFPAKLAKAFRKFIIVFRTPGTQALDCFVSGIMMRSDLTPRCVCVSLTVSLSLSLSLSLSICLSLSVCLFR